jgi:hypothetical protein
MAPNQLLKKRFSMVFRRASLRKNLKIWAGGSGDKKEGSETILRGITWRRKFGKVDLKGKWLFAGPDRPRAGAIKFREMFPRISVLSKPPELPYGPQKSWFLCPRGSPNFLQDFPRYAIACVFWYCRCSR